MQLNDILEEHSIKAISKKTNISEENLEYLVAANFDALKKVKTLGFISIIEREYHADLGELREQALEYYGSTREDTSITLGRPIVEEKKGRSKFLSFFVLLLIGYASWYFFTQFDKKHLSELIPFVDEQMIESFVGEKENETKEEIVEDLSIAKVIVANTQTSDERKEVSTVEKGVVTEKKSEENATKSTETIREDTTAAKTTVNVSIVPVGKLWFGVIDVETKKRDHFSIAKAYALEVGNKTWLVATSSAPFSLVRLGVTKDFSDAKEHYFKIDKNGIESLSKDEYITFGGWSRW
jgi:hypothetical protein